MSKPKLTAKVEETLVNALKVGAPKNLACELAGISRETLRLWLANDGNKSFTKKVTKSSAEGRFALFTRLRLLIDDKNTPAQVRIQAITWLLERVDRENFGFKGTLEHLGKDGGPIAFTLDDLTKTKEAVDANDT